MSKSEICHSCKAKLIIFKKFSNYFLVSSDCKPTYMKGDIAICSKCSLIQKPVNSLWKKRVNKIYKKYEMFKNAKGEDQKLFNSKNNNQNDRSSEILNLISSKINLPNKGRVLDIGCGTGPFLNSFSYKYKKWNLYGLEQDNRFKKKLNIIKNFKKLFLSLDEINEKFDLIVLIHTLEHIPNPILFLKKIKILLKKSGYLFIQVPDFDISPFDILVADHSSHFTRYDFKSYVYELKFKKKFLLNNIIPKEISFLLQNQIQKKYSIEHFSKSRSVILKKKLKINTYFESYEKLFNKIKKLRGEIAIFGTSIAATWVAQSIKNKNYKFIDQDKNKIGNFHMNKKILSTKELYRFENIIMPFRRDLSLKIIKSLNLPKKRFILLDK